MKSIAKLALFFNNVFILFFVFSALFRFISLWIESVRTMPDIIYHNDNLVSALYWAVPASLYAAILICHTYAARKNISVFPSIMTVIVLSAVYTFGVSLSINNFSNVNYFSDAAPAVKQQAGLILTRSQTNMILLRENDPRGPRVLSFPDQNLIYQGEAWGPVNPVLAHELPFDNAVPWFIQSVLVDFALSARQIRSRIEENFGLMVIYGGSLIVLLGSFRFLLGLSSWPLANLFLGALVFRSILGFETLINQAETQQFILSFTGNRLIPNTITPLIFFLLGIFILVYTFLSYIAWGKEKKNA